MLEHGIAPATGVAYEIDNSLRFNDDDSAYLSWTPTSAGNRKTFTISTWVKRGNVGQYSWILGAGSSNRFYLAFQSDDTMTLMTYEGTTPKYKTTSAKYRDPSAWYHITAVVDTSNATAEDRQRIYVNGERVTDWASNVIITQNTDVQNINTATTHYLGTRSTLDREFDGYMAETHFIDGQALDPSNFGETGDYGEWKPIEYTGTYGTNGFYLDFEGTDDNIVDASGTSSLTINSNVAHSTSQAKFGQSSIEFATTSNVNADSGHGIEYTGNSSNCPTGTNNITFECWMYSTNATWGNTIWHGHQFDWYMPALRVNGSGYIYFANQSDGGSNWYSVTSDTVLPQNQWVHIACTISNKVVTLWQDGVQVGTRTWTTGTWGVPSGKQMIGAGLSCFVDEIRISNSIRYSTTFTPPTTTFTSDANTQLLIHSDYSGIGVTDDKSGNANNWTQNNITYDDQMLDSPTNNFCTGNPLASAGVSGDFLEGNLKIGHLDKGTAGTMGMSSGKWYFEGLARNYLNTFGIVYEDALNDLTDATTTDGFAQYGGTNKARSYWNGYKLDASTRTAYGDAYVADDIIGVAFDADAGSLTFYRNGVSQGVAFTGLPSGTWLPLFHSYTSTSGVLNFGQDSSFAGYKTAQGNTDDNGYGDFYYAPPTGYLALCTQNLPDATVIPSEHFNTLVWSGNSTDNRAITGVGFAPDLTWIKNRSAAVSHVLHDKVRGTDGSTYYYLLSNATNAEGVQTDGDGLVSLDVDGYTLGYFNGTNWNASGNNYVGWNWKANGSGVSNTDGTVTSTVSANTSAGFSVITYTGTGASMTYGHGLSQAPELVITKCRSQATDWVTWHDSFGSPTTSYLKLNTTNGTLTYADVWGTINSSTIQVPNSYSDWNTSSATYVSYAFHSVDGFSKVGSYTSNGSTDGPFVYTGFRPAYVMIKSASYNQNWIVFDDERDTYNQTDHALLPNSSGVELITADRVVDFTSNGFKIRANSAELNYSVAGNYVFYAVAENPFKHSNAR